MGKDLLTGVEKVALVISAMDSNQARKFFAMLTKEEITKIQNAMKNLNKIDKSQKELIISDFTNDVQDLVNIKRNTQQLSF